MIRKQALGIGLLITTLTAGCGVTANQNQGKNGSQTNQTTGTNHQNTVATNHVASNVAATNTVNTGNVSNPPAQTTPTWPVVHVSRMPSQYPVGLIGNSLAVSAGNLYSVGGYTGSYSVSSVYRVGTAVTRIASLPARTHDAASGFLGNDLYVFGGGQSASYDTVVRIHSGQAAVVSHLSAPLSDAVAVPFVYQGQSGLVVLGGYDGQVFRKEAHFVHSLNGHLVWTSLFSLPEGLRYTAMATFAGTIYFAGGKTASGYSHTVYAWSAGQGLRTIATMPYSFEKAAAFVDGNFLIVAGGKNSSGSPSSAIYAINLATGHYKTVGNLPIPLADMGYAQSGKQGYLAGGSESANDATISRDIYVLTF